MFDAIVVGGGPAGLSAALMLGRCRRRVLVCDLGLPRNRRSRALHGYLTRDGAAPADLIALGRAELQTYGVAVRPVGVTSAVRTDGGGFRISLSGGGSEDARFLLLATGVADALPMVAGIEECYGRSAFHCPYCDGWEWRDRRLAALGRASQAARLALALKTWSADVVACVAGRLDPALAARLAANDIPVRTARVTRLEHVGGALRAIVFASGDALPRDALFFATGQHPQSDLAMQLGCALTRHGTVRTGGLSDTNVPGVFVAGDASRDAQFVVVAAAEGVKAAVAINKALQKAELA